MSELINNVSKRQEALKQIIQQIHDGLPLEQAKFLFKEQFSSVSTEEIVALEQALIAEGMKVEEVQRLCDVHAALFDGSIEDIHKPKSIQDTLGHPLQVFHAENQRILQLIQEEILPYSKSFNPTNMLMLQIGLERLSEIDKHYQRKENLFFPVLEKRGNHAIPKVMWGVDNEIRVELKNILKQFQVQEGSPMDLFDSINHLIERIKDMVMKEENILSPLLSDSFKTYDWILIDKESKEIGYFLDTEVYDWVTKTIVKKPKEDKPKNTNTITFDAGSLNQIEINAILNTVPFDMTFVDKDGLVKYFTQGKERIFPRPMTVLGRHVHMCHPPQSVHIVEEIIESFKQHKKDHEDFWIQMKDQFVHIRYYAIRDSSNEYLGTLEVTQDILPIRMLEGEKRLIKKEEKS